MHRVTITLDDDLMEKLDAIIAERGYQNRSEAIRDLARIGIQQTSRDAGDDAACFAAMIYTYDHSKRDLPNRLAENFHHHHEMSRATLHVHLDHDNCLEVAILNGKPADINHVADHVFTERGVRYGRVVMIPPDGEERG
jgi:CopG family nickel-responsive transcriptional regulator